MNRDNIAAALLLAAAVVGVSGAAVWMDGGDVPLGRRTPTGYAEEQLATGLAQPTALAVADDGRVFVAQRTGELLLVDDGGLRPEPVLRVETVAAEDGGLTGLALDPDFATNGFIYVAYTVTGPPAHNRVSRFTLAADAAVPGSETVLFDNGGGPLAVADDGSILVATAGAVLRIGADGSIPDDNPFDGAVWAVGLDDPGAIAVDPAAGRTYVTDHSGTISEVNELHAGADYAGEEPLYGYGRDQGCEPAGIAVAIGGVLVADACLGWIRALNPDVKVPFDFGAVAEPGTVGLATLGVSVYYLSGTGLYVMAPA